MRETKTMTEELERIIDQIHTDIVLPKIMSVDEIVAELLRNINEKEKP